MIFFGGLNHLAVRGRMLSRHREVLSCAHYVGILNSGTFQRTRPKPRIGGSKGGSRKPPAFERRRARPRRDGRLERERKGESARPRGEPAGSERRRRSSREDVSSTRGEAELDVQLAIEVFGKPNRNMRVQLLGQFDVVQVKALLEEGDIDVGVGKRVKTCGYSTRRLQVEEPSGGASGHARIKQRLKAKGKAKAAIDLSYEARQ
jgi:hypothetical protein